MSTAQMTPQYPNQLHFLEMERNAPTAFCLVLRPTANSASMAGIPTASTLNRKTSRKAAPPCLPAIYGKRHNAPRPMALPAATNITLNLPPNEALGSLLIAIVFKIDRENNKKAETNNNFMPFVSAF